MASDAPPALPFPSADDEKALQEIAGYLNFASGKPDPRFQKHLNDFWGRLEPPAAWSGIRQTLEQAVARQQSESAAFADSEQASRVLSLVFDQLEPTYRQHHADLLFHLQPADFQTPFFLARLFEAVLQQGPPWTETERIVGGALQGLNDYLGHRPVPVLESGQAMQPYLHERFRPIPLYLAGAGVAHGPYHDLLAKALEHLQATPPDFLAAAHFELALLEELALDVRAYDHQHPMYKRTNYMFGEWDPHRIDSKGNYRRFVLRAIVLDALADWMRSVKDHSREEVLFEAAAVLCGTMLMASTISGSGPQTYDSTISLGTLLPKVARQRDAFYSRLLDSLSGPLAERLRREAKLARQPFGKVRQHLNLFVANQGSRQVQHSQLAYLYAKMGFPEASRQTAAVIPAVSTRFECEIEWRLTSGHLHLDRGELDQAASLVPEVEDLLERGIACGGLVDPWNILGFQGNFPLFHNREDAVSDPRVEKLLMLMEDIFGLNSRLLSEAAAEGRSELQQSLSRRFEALATHWDQYASTTVSGLPEVSGAESYESARHVAEALAEWHSAGEAAGDVSFWRQHVDRFESAKAYALVLESLLRKQDSVAALALLIQWLSQAEAVGLESGSHSFHRLILRWMRMTTRVQEEPPLAASSAPPSSRRPWREAWPSLRRMFAYFEANAGDFWHVPQLESRFLRGGVSEAPPESGELELPVAPDPEEDDDGGEDTLFRAAYEDVVYRDTAQDGIVGDTVDSGDNSYNTDLDLLTRNLEGRLKFLVTMSRLWQMAAVTLASPAPDADAEAEAAAGPLPLEPEQVDALLHWSERTRVIQAGLLELMSDVWKITVPKPSGDHDSLVEYDRQLQLKFSILNSIVFTHVACHEAAWSLMSCLPDQPGEGLPGWELQTMAIYRSILRGSAAEVRQQLPALIAALSRQPLLYVPLDKGGAPQRLLLTRTLQSVIRSLLVQLPRLGLFREAWHLLRTAQKMERHSPRGGTVITEFDRLFHAAFRSSLESLVRQTEQWGPEQVSDRQLIELVSTLTDHYLEQWLEHSETMRLSSLETLADDEVWENVKDFITEFGHDFFHAQMLTLGNIRAILHNGVEPFLAYLAENEDPLHPLPLLEELESPAERAEAVVMLELIFRVTVEKFERYMEYNTTTTQSDYGEQFHSFLDFLRVEASYERQAWNLLPLVTAHEVLVRAGRSQAAEIWRREFQARTADAAKRHLQWLRKLEKLYGMRLPSITDQLNERFVKPLTLDRIVALVPLAMQDARRQQQPSAAFKALRSEAEKYLKTTTGSGLDIPAWLRNIENEVHAAEWADSHDPGSAEFTIAIPTAPLRLEELQEQFDIWQTPLKRNGHRKKP